MTPPGRPRRGGLHAFLHDLYETGATADGNADGFERALGNVCAARGIDGWQNLLRADEQRHFFKDGGDPGAQRVIEFWAELDEPLSF